MTEDDRIAGLRATEATSAASYKATSAAPYSGNHPKQQRYQFNPQKDITAWELSFIMARMIFISGNCLKDDGIHMGDEVWDGLPDVIKRHFQPWDEMKRG